MRHYAAMVALTAILSTVPFTVRAAEAPALLQRQLVNSMAGKVLDVSSLSPTPPYLPKLSVTRTWTGGTLVFSGSPEYVPGPGVLYADTLPPGPVHLFLYHVNASYAAGDPRPLKLSVIVEPADTAQPGGIVMRRRIIHGPSSSYSYVGTQAAVEALSLPDTPMARDISGPFVLDPNLEQRVIPAASYEQLVQAQYDFDITGAPMRVTVVALDATEDTLATYGTLPVLQREEKSPGVYWHDRGTYAGHATKRVESIGTFVTSAGMAHIRMASGSSDPIDPDPFAGQGTPAGRDALLDIPSVLRGSYGVTYTVRLRLNSPDGRRVAILLNPRGGSYAGAVKIGDSLTGAGTYLAPMGGQIIPPNTAATVLGRWDPRKTPEITLVWTPPGASFLPVEWVLVPYPEPGDVNGSGAVELADALMALRFRNRLSTPNPRQLIAADVVPYNAPDGIIDLPDVSAILRRAALSGD